MLQGIGLTDAEEETYRTLLRYPSLALPELADRHTAGVTVTRRHVEALVAAGLATADDGCPPRYTAVDPRFGIMALVRSRQAGLDRAAGALSFYSADYEEGMLRAKPHRLVEVIETPAAINSRIRGLLDATEQEILAFDAPPYVAAEATSASSEARLLNRGVQIRAVYAGEALAIPGKVSAIQEQSELGEIARVAVHVPLKMVVLDRRSAIVPLTAAEAGTRSAAAVVGQSRLCDALVELFEATWAHSSPVFKPGANTGADPADRQLLGLLGAGMKDEAIARQLGISERTVRRRIADLLVRLGVTSRFQAGAQAVRRGWI